MSRRSYRCDFPIAIARVAIAFSLLTWSFSCTSAWLSAQEQATQAGDADADPAAREAALLYNAASRLYRQESWKEAARAFEEFLARFPKNPDATDARFALGYALHRLGEHARAAIELGRALASPASAPAAWAADAYLARGRSLEALAAKETDENRRRERWREAAEAFGRSAALHTSKLPSKTKADAKSARSGPADASSPRLEALSAQGEALYNAGLAAEAARALEGVEAEESQFRGAPGFARALHLLALAQLSLERGGETAAAARARKLLGRLTSREFEQDPSTATIREESAFLLARLLHRGGERREAVELYAQAEALRASRAAEAGYYGALALEELGQEAAGAADLEEASTRFARFAQDRAVHPLAQRARLHAGFCLFALGRYGDAALPFADVVRGSARPGAPESTLAGVAGLRLGQALLLKDPPDPKAARTALENALEAFGGTGEGNTPEDVARGSRAEAKLWRAEAILASGGTSADDAAPAFEDVAEKERDAAPELAERALYQAARTRLAQGRHKTAFALALRYRERYPDQKARFSSAVAQIQAECARLAGPEGLPGAEKNSAAIYYAEAARFEADVGRARRLRYLSGLAALEGGDAKTASATLSALSEEVTAAPLDGFREPELPFRLASAILASATSPPASPGARAPATDGEFEPWRRAESLLSEYVASSPDGAQSAPALRNLALCRGRLGKSAEARASLKAFLERFPKHALAAEARAEFAALLEGVAENDTALLEYRRAAIEARDPLLRARSLLRAAAIERRLGRHTDAARTLGALLEQPASPGKESAGEFGDLIAEARLARAIALRDSGDTAGARRELEAILREPSGDRPEALPAARNRSTAARLALARLLLAEGHAKEALATLQPIVQARSDDAGVDEALYLSGFALAKLADAGGERPEEPERLRAEAEACYRRVVARTEESPGARSFAVQACLEIGQLRLRTRDHGEARTWFAKAESGLSREANEASATDPANLERARFGLALAAYEEKDYAGALPLFDRTAERPESPLAPRALFQAARAAALAGDDRAAAERLERLLALEPPRRADLSEEAMLRLGESRGRLGKHREAIEVLERLLRDAPAGALRHEANFAIGFERQLLGEFEAAEERYRSVIAGSASPVAARAGYHLGECLLERGRTRDAALAFTTVVANFDREGPYQEWVRRSLLAAGLAYRDAGDPSAARAQLEDLVKRFPQTDEGRAASQHLKELKEK